MIALVLLALAQGPVERAAWPDGFPVPEEVADGFGMRMVGPSRGGRVTTVTGVLSKPHTFYMGSTGGGVWRTENAGRSWTNLTDDAFAVGSIGAVAVAPSDPNVIWVGTGSASPRGNISVGNGVYRSTDEGRTWTHVGLPGAGLIGRIAVDPDDPDRAFVAALGQIFGRSPDRGVYRTGDAGETWEPVLQISDAVGAVDLAMSPANPRVLFAAMWQAERKPWDLVDGGPDGGLYRTADGGDTWELLGRGLPEASEERPLGRIGVSIAASRPSRVYALVTAAEQRGGLYRSEDGGDSWTRINGDRRLRTRGWYYSHVAADPNDADTIYVMNAPFLKSVDAGVSFEVKPTPHGDNHDLWIRPGDSRIMVEANDGGANVTLDGGKTWSSIHNQPTAEFYRLTVDDGFPRRLYGAQQDNSTISVPAWTDGGLSPEAHWLDVAGGESGHIAVTPGNPELSYAGNYIGQIDRLDQNGAGARNVIAYPQLADGVAPKDLRYRFQWNAPILVSRHDPDVVLHASNHVHRTTDGGLTWETISPDLTVNDAERQLLPGRPVQHDHTGVEVYGTVFALAESPGLPGLLWAGSDDGRVHLTRDSGATWIEVTPPGMPSGGTVNSVDASFHENGGALVTVHRYRENDFAPYLFRTADFGATWTRIESLPPGHPVRAARQDPVDPDLLFVGTEFGLFASFDGGERFVPFGGIPATPITDIQIAGDELLVATQGRSFWVFDDLTPLRGIMGRDWSAPALLPSGAAVRLATGGGRGFRGPGAPENRPPGALLHYFLPEEVEGPLSLTIRDAAGEVARRFVRKPDEDAEGPPEPDATLEADEGFHRVVWDLKEPRPKLQPDTFMSISYTGGAFVPPGGYAAVLEAGDVTSEIAFDVRPDPRSPWTEADLAEQHRVARAARDLLETIHDRIGAIREVREQVEAARERVPEGEARELADALLADLEMIEETLIQTRNESGQDPINFPPKLDNQVAYLYGHVARNYGRPTEGSRERLADLQREAGTVLDRLRERLGAGLDALNEAFAEAGITGAVGQESSGGRAARIPSR